MPKGNMSNMPGIFPGNQSSANFAVDTPDGVHFSGGAGVGPIDLGPYRVGPMMPATHTGATSAPALIGNKSGKGKTVTVR